MKKIFSFLAFLIILTAQSQTRTFSEKVKFTNGTTELTVPDTLFTMDATKALRWTKLTSFATKIKPLLGFVKTTGTPLDNQVSIFTNANTLEGNPLFTFNGSDLYVGTSGANNVRLISSLGFIDVNSSTGDWASLRPTQLIFHDVTNSRSVFIEPPTLTNNFTQTLQNKAGTFAYLDDITGTNSGTNTGDQTSIVGITGTLSQFNTAITDGAIGDVFKSGTPLVNQVAYFLDGNTLQSSSAFTFDGTDFTFGDTNSILSIKGLTGVSTMTANTRFDVISNDGLRIEQVGASVNNVTIKYPTTGTHVLTAPNASGKIVATVGTPLINEIGVYSGDGMLSRFTDFTWNNSTKIFTIGANGSDLSTINFNNSATIVYDDGSGETTFDHLIVADGINANDFTDSNGTASVTGTIINLSDNITGKLYNVATPSSATTFTTTLPKTGGYAQVFINTTSEPTVTSATKRSGATWTTGVDMKMIVGTDDGINTWYYFISL